MHLLVNAFECSVVHCFPHPSSDRPISHTNRWVLHPSQTQPTTIPTLIHTNGHWNLVRVTPSNATSPAPRPSSCLCVSICSSLVRPFHIPSDSHIRPWVLSPAHRRHSAKVCAWVLSLCLTWPTPSPGSQAHQWELQHSRGVLADHILGPLPALDLTTWQRYYGLAETKLPPPHPKPAHMQANGC